MGLLEALLEVVAPTRCAGCDAPGELLCARCREAMPRVDSAYACPSCAAPFGYITCTECWEREFAFAGAVAVGSLERPLSRAITLYKDAGERRLAEEFGRMAANVLAPCAGGAGCVVPVPASRAAIVRRGFDHMTLIAQAAAAALDLPVRHALEIARAIDQRGLGREARRANAAEALALAPGTALEGRVLLLDDVFTTGATLDAAAALLQSAGAAEVRVAVLARAW